MLCYVLYHLEVLVSFFFFFFFFKQKTAYELRISDWSSDVCSSDLSQTKPAIGSTPASVASPALVNGNDSPASSSPRDSAAASPATRKRARELGVDITQVNPSAASGRISRDDVEDRKSTRLNSSH